MENEQPRLNIVRGLIAAAAGGGIAQVAVVVELACLAMLRWLTSNLHNPSFSKEAEILANDSLMPFVGCILIGACTGWTTFAPHGRHRVAWTLVKLFMMIIAQWFLAGALGLGPGRRHAIPTPAYEFHQFCYLIAPILIATILLTILRISQPVVQPRIGD